MSRVRIDNEKGRWFDSEKADKYEEKTYWDGSNHISKATGSQWNHEAIYITKGGVFVLNIWSQYQGSREIYETITKEQAAEWFIKNEYEDDAIPDIFSKEIAEREIE